MAEEKKTANVKETKLDEAKLREEELQEVPAAPIAEPIPATDADMAAADPAVVPAEEAPVEEAPAVEEAPVADPVDQAMFTPPAEGYVPAGWVKIEDLAAAVAQATGDVEAASVAPDVQDASAGVAPVETEAAVPAEVPTEQPLVAPVQESVEEPAEEEKIEEAVDAGDCAEEAVSEDEKAGEEFYNNEDLPDEAKINESEDVCPECGKNPCECESGEKELSEAIEDEIATDDPVEEAEGDVVEDEIAADDVAEDVADDAAEEVVEDAADGDTDDLAVAEMMAEPTEEDVDLLDKISAFLDDVEADAEEDKEEAEEKEEGIASAAAALKNSSDFLKSLVDDEEDYGVDVSGLDFGVIEDDDEEDEEEDEEEDLEVEDDFSDVEFEDDDEDVVGEEDEEEKNFDESVERIPVELPDSEIKKDNIEKKEELKVRESYEGFLPAGSEHFANEVNDDNLVESYEKSAAARRRALAKFRESLRNKKVEETPQKFAEALRGSSRLYHVYDADDSKSWAANRFEEKFEEKQKLNYRELLENGFLG